MSNRPSPHAFVSLLAAALLSACGGSSAPQAGATGGTGGSPPARTDGASTPIDMRAATADAQTPGNTSPDVGAEAALPRGMDAGPDLPPAETGSAEAPLAPTRICNGEPRITFSFVTLLPLAETEPGSQLVFENGASYVRIDGQCRFWTFGTSAGNSPLDDIRTGTLSPAEADQIATELRFREWGNLKGDYGRGFAGAPATMLSDGVSEVVCWALCTHPDAPAGMRDLFAKGTAVLDRLSRAGQPVTGPVRLALQNRQADAPDFPYPTVPWPLARPMTEFVIPFGIAKPGTAFQVTGADADELRKLRRAHRTSAALKSGVTFVPIKQAAGPLHSLYVRDSIPYEDDHGLIPRK